MHQCPPKAAPSDLSPQISCLSSLIPTASCCLPFAVLGSLGAATLLTLSLVLVLRCRPPPPHLTRPAPLWYRLAKACGLSGRLSIWLAGRGDISGWLAGRGGCSGGGGGPAISQRPCPSAAAVAGVVAVAGVASSVGRRSRDSRYSRYLTGQRAGVRWPAHQPTCIPTNQPILTNRPTPTD